MSDSAKAPRVKPLSLVWLRRDLRFYDHAAFAAAAKTGDSVQAVFVFDKDILKRFGNKEDRRLTFIAETLCALDAQIRKKGGALLVLHGESEKIIPALCSKLGATHLFAAEDFEPETRRRDDKVGKALKGNTECHWVLDHLLMSPQAILKSDGTPYKVFTPYSKAWRKIAAEDKHFAAEQTFKTLHFADYHNIKKLAGRGMNVLEPAKGAKAMLEHIGYTWVKTGWPVDKGRSKLSGFIHDHIAGYKTQRNYMGSAGTSRLSPYLRHGLVSVRECARLALQQEADRGGTGATTWLGELIWRDFYAMILYYFPHTATQEMQKKYQGLKWSYDKKLFRRFAQGMTGYPVVDAAMRELLETGYMHNRARMIVASFMTKDLLLDWRMGEEHFAQYLMDYELASNVGGWQWAASTGTDAQPYFRVFNPVLQSRKFDPEGVYIRRFVPELKALTDKDIHEPWKKAKPEDYPLPIVDHDMMRGCAIELFRKASAS